MARRIVGGVDNNNQRGINFADPSAATDAATKQYVDNVAAGNTYKQSVRAATTANITLSGTQTIDGVALVAGDRVLVKDQSTGSANGAYVVAAGAWSRTSDADTTAEVQPGIAFFVNEGTVNSDKTFNLVTNAPIVLGTTSLLFSTSASGGGSYTAGTGLILSGSQFSLDPAYGRFETDVPAGSASAVITHNLGTLYPAVVAVYEKTAGAGSTPVLVDVDTNPTSINALTLIFPTAPTSGQYRVVVKL